MCRCCQSCWEDLYWSCIEEKFCYDETIAHYNPDEDEYFSKKQENGFLTVPKLENNNSPIVIQPAGINRFQRNASHSNISKIHEDDYRQIQINGPFLAPEILSVFANSQIFHDHQPLKKSASSAHTPGVHGRSAASSPRGSISEKLLLRLEGDGGDASSSKSPDSATAAAQSSNKIHFIIDSDHSSSANSLTSPKLFPSIREEDPSIPEEDNDIPDDENSSKEEIKQIRNEIVLRPKLSDIRTSSQQSLRTPILNKRLRNVQSVPYFSFRPASENDIFSISGNPGQFSMTPEIPSISYSTLPKNYEDTPTIEKYKESVSLYSIQTANISKTNQFDFSMPRYFGKSDIFGAAQSADNISVPAQKKMITSPGKRVEKSKRLKLLRTNLPPLSIHLGKERSKDKGIE